MTFISRVEASRRAKKWGYTKPTEREAMLACLAAEKWSAADSGSLIRIADALESIAVSLDPERRAKRSAKIQQRAEFEKNRRARDVKSADNYRRMARFVNDWNRKHGKYLDLLRTNGGKIVARAIKRGMMEAVHSFCDYPWVIFGRRLRDILKATPDELLDLRLWGIGPVTRKQWMELHANVQGETERQARPSDGPQESLGREMNMSQRAGKLI